jgi:DNA-binding response OmpR family regulator
MKKILIIEDDAMVAHIYQTRLEKAAFEVKVTQDGQTGFYLIQEFCPDAILLDLMLPRMNGIDILKKIRAQAQFARTPILVFTNAYVPNMVQEAFQSGANQVFNKASLTPRQIIDAIQGALATAHAQAGTEGTPSNPPRFEENSKQAPAEGANALDALDAELRRNAAPQSNEPNAQATIPPSYDPKDEEFQQELLQAFSDQGPQVLSELRKALQDFTKCQDVDERLEHLLMLYRKVHSLTSSAGIAGLRNISHIAAALEVLLKELYEKPKNINASSMRTVAHSIDFLADLFSSGCDFDLLESGPVHILVVDDEILSRRAITYALEKANLKSVSVEDSQVALNLAAQTTFDLIFLDVQMPGMDGFELCSRIKALPTNRHTGVIFVTSLTDFKSRARSSLSGANDLIAKPFMFIELSVKALTYVFRGRLAQIRSSQAA